jgi:cytochrome c5
LRLKLTTANERAAAADERAAAADERVAAAADDGEVKGAQLESQTSRITHLETLRAEPVMGRSSNRACRTRVL